MFSSLHRILPFWGRRGRRENGGRQSEAALNRDLDEAADDESMVDTVSDNWCSLSNSNNKGAAADVEPQKDSRAAAGSSKSGSLSRRHRAKRDEYLVDDDISKGRELHKLPAVSYKRGDKPPLDFHYVVDHIQYQPVQVDSSLVSISSCECRDDCNDGHCYCASGVRSSRYYDSHGRLHPDYNLNSPQPIYECNAACKCNRKRCKNMVIQNGCKHRLVLFRTRSRGWGIRTLEHLKRGTFVGLYSGELVSAADSATRLDDTYLFNLASTQVYYRDQTTGGTDVQTVDAASADKLAASANHQEQETLSVEYISDSSLPAEEACQEAKNEPQQQQQEQQFVCDAKFYGNFTRFVNHSCEPNVIGIRSFTSHQDSRFPHIAFFTNQDIPAFSELTLNYGDNYWLVKCKRDSCYCLCKRPSCRFNKKTFATTLSQHKQQNKN